jgi:uncharacterized protein
MPNQATNPERVESERAGAEILSELTRRLVVGLQPERVILFGSHAWGVPDENSDVDLLVILPESELPATQRAMLAHRCLRGVSVPVDVLVKTSDEVERASRVHTSLISEILDQGRVLYG